MTGRNGSGLAVRKSLSTRTRFEVFKRDGFVCQYCGAHPPEVILHIDHIVAVKDGGQDVMDNLITSCAPCNLGKSSVPLTSVPQSLSDKAADIQEREDQLFGYYAIMESRRQRIEDEAWQVAEVLEPGCSKKGFNKADLRSIKKFIEKLGFHEVLDSMEAAVARVRSRYGAFKYFCGTCWGKIRGD